MNNKKTSFFAGDFTRLAYRFALIFALIVPLADTVLISPACGAVLANVGDGVLYEILSRLSELAVTAAFLSMCALVVCAVFADLRALALRLLLLEGLSFIFIGVLLKSAMLWVCAALDECLFTELGSFALSNYTLAQINDQLLVWWSMISCFMNVLMLCVVVLALGLVIVVVVSSPPQEQRPSVKLITIHNTKNRDSALFIG